MSRCLLILWFLGSLASLSQAVEFSITSPEKGEVWPKSSLVNRSLRWKEKEQQFIAEVTFSTAEYAGWGDAPQQESYEFPLPGITYDPTQKLFFALAPNGEKIPVAQRTKVFLGTRIDLYKTATIHVSRFKSQLTLSLTINSSPPVEVPIANGEDGVKSVPLDALFSH